MITPSFLPVIGVGISIALLTQVEGEAFARAGILVLLGLVLWCVNFLVLRREGTGDGPPARAER